MKKPIRGAEQTRTRFRPAMLNQFCLIKSLRLEGEGGLFADCLPARNIQQKFCKFSGISQNFLEIRNCSIDFIKIAEILRNSGKIPLKSQQKNDIFHKFQSNFAKISDIHQKFAKICKKSAFLNLDRCKGVRIL